MVSDFPTPTLLYTLYSAVERLIEKEPSLVHAKKSDGYTALHIAVINDHQDSANILILKVRHSTFVTFTFTCKGLAMFYEKL